MSNISYNIYGTFVRSKISLTEKLMNRAVVASHQEHLLLIPPWISNHMPNKMWDEITYPFPNFNGCVVDV